MSAPPVRLNLLMLPNARHDCAQCGTCCKSYRLGPVHPDTVQRLEEEDWSKHGIDLGGEPITVKVQHKGATAHYLRQQEDGTCIFMGSGGACVVHRHLGLEAKPWFCQSFPYYMIASPKGLHFGISMDCSAQHKSMKSGTPLGRHFNNFSLILDRYPMTRFAPNALVLTPPHTVLLKAYPVLEDNLTHLATTAFHRGPGHGVALLRSYLDRVCDAMPTSSPAAQAQHMDAVIDREMLVPDGGDKEQTWTLLRELLAVLVSGYDDQDRSGMPAVNVSKERTILNRWTAKLAEPQAPKNLTSLSDEGCQLAHQQFNNYLFGKFFRSFPNLYCGLGAYTLLALLPLAVHDGDTMDADSYGHLSAQVQRVIKLKNNLNLLVKNQKKLTALFRAVPPEA